MLTVLRNLRRSSLVSHFRCSRQLSSDFSVIPEDDPSSSAPVQKQRVKTEPLFHSRDDFFAKYPPLAPTDSREAWLEDLSVANDDSSNEILKLHPDIWAVKPRLDVIYANVEWQRWYKRVDYEYVKDRYEMEYHQNRRPWPQKGTGRARHATTTSPIWIQGGKAHGNKGPRAYFHMIPYNLRVWGLIHTLSAKYAQDDVRFVRNLEIPSENPEYIEDLINSRGWALSTLIVDVNDQFPRNLTAATMSILHVNMMPAFGLNVHDMLKHQTLVLTKAAVEHIEDRLLFAQRRMDCIEKKQSANMDPNYEMPYHNPSGSLS